MAFTKKKSKILNLFHLLSKRKISLTALITLLLILFASLSHAVVLNVPEVSQEQNQWCWAGVSQATLSYYGTNVAQCTMADWARVQNGWGVDNCCANPSGAICNQPNWMYGASGSLQSILVNWGVDSNGRSYALSQATVESEISVGRPFEIRWGWDAGGGHFLVGRGIIGSNVYYMDPWPGNGYSIGTYAWVVSGGGHTWTHSLQITTDVGCPPDAYEPDDSSGQASSISSGVPQTHSICPVGDEDWVTFTLTDTSGSGVVLETSGPIANDTLIWLYDSNLTEIAIDDDGGTGLYSLIERFCETGEELSPGTYYVKVDEYGDNNEIESYDISLNVTPCECIMPFTDVPLGYWAEDYINAIYCAGITTGYPDGTYRPENQVTRAQMATFIIRALHGESFSYGSTPYFPDVSASHWAFKYVQRLYEEGITIGFPDGTYRPETTVTRAQMATFIIRALYGESFSYSGTPYFPDCAPSDWEFKYVQRLSEDGITTGFPDGTYRPEDVVTRAQMAAFLSRAFLGMP